ncbi:hypothetical protein N2152v2_001505 [Parachlorella kessleri]
MGLLSHTGGRWLDPKLVEAEPAGGYGQTHRHKQTSSEEVKEAVAKSKEPAYVAEDEKKREARAQAQGYKYLDASNMPSSIPRQEDTPEYQEALHAAQTPEFQEKKEKAAEAKHQASGGRW